jgi:hypothetical protein
MRIGKALVAAFALMGLAASSARAEDYVQVQKRSNPAGTVLRDTITGGLVGSAVSGGIILYNMGIQDKNDYDWQRTLAWGAVIGLGAGLVWGIVDAASGPSYAMISRNPVHDGQSMSLDVRARDQSGTQLFEVMRGRF